MPVESKLPATETAVLEDVELEYVIEGDGDETVVLVAGLGDDLNSWDVQVPALAGAGFRVLRFNNRGIGRSSCPEPPYTTHEMARDLYGLVHFHGLGDFHLIGNSLGGMIAQAYVSSFASSLLSLTLSCTALDVGPIGDRLFGQWERNVPRLGPDYLAVEAALWSFSRETFSDKEADVQGFEDEVRAGPPPLKGFLGQIAALRAHRTHGPPTRPVPRTLVVSGLEDRIFPEPLQTQLAKAFAARHVFVPGGHACQWESADFYNTVLLEFLSAPRLHDSYRLATPWHGWGGTPIYNWLR